MLRNTFTNRLLLVTAVLCTASLLFFANACNEKLGVVDADKGFPAESITEFGQGYLIGFHGEPDVELIRNVGGRILRAYNNFPILHVDVPEQAVQELQDNPKVRYVERNSLIHAEKPDGSFMDCKDTGFAMSSTTNECEVVINYSHEEIITEPVSRIGAPSAWDKGFTGQGIRVAVFDSGIDREHPDLKGNVADFGLATYAGRNRNWYVDVIGHGTRNAGVIGADGTHLYGVAPEVELVSVKVMIEYEGKLQVYLDNAIRGIDWCIDRDIHIIYMGWGYLDDPLGPHEAFEDAVIRAWEAGILLVASAGNTPDKKLTDNSDELKVRFPAAFGNVIAVAALNEELDGIASLSRFGPEVELVAPGMNINTTYIDDTGFTCRNGTAYSAGFVAGAAALVWSANPVLSNVNVRDILQNNAECLGLDENHQGVGLIRADWAVDAVAGHGTEPDPEPEPEPPTADFTYQADGLSVQFTDASADSDGSITAWSWSFGDGASSTVQHPVHTYAADGTYTVSLTVTDDGGETGTTSKDVTVASDDSPPPPPPGDITLTVEGYKVQGRWQADLTWTPSGTSTYMDVFRDNSFIVTTQNDGFHTDATNFRGGGSLTYKVCETETVTCSNEVTVEF